jgi:putative hydrolase of the HAD superfamily
MKESAVSSAVHAMIEAGLDLDEKSSYERIITLYQETGWENQQIFDIFLKEKTGEVDNKYLAAAIVSYRRAREATLRLYPDVQRTLNILGKMGLKLAVVSDAPSREAWMRIYYLNLHHVFDLVLTFDDVGERKPSPKGFEMALEKLGIKTDEALMIGDWPERDVAGASKLGIKTIYAKYGDTFGTVESGADWDVENIYEVVGIIKSLND